MLTLLLTNAGSFVLGALVGAGAILYAINHALWR